MTPTPIDSTIAVLSELIADALREAPQPAGDADLPLLPGELMALALDASAPQAAVMQLLTPSIPWDWPEAVAGSIPYQQFTFADSVPASVAPSVPYTATATSLSQNYKSFLNLLAADSFPLKPLLDDVLGRCTPPNGSPGSMIAPDGWVCAPDGAGISRWRPAYGVSMTPSEWVAQVAANAADEVELALPLAGDVMLKLHDAEGGHQALALQGNAGRAVICARALTQVSLTPGRWYDASLLQLGRNGPFVHGLAGTVPYEGLLTARVSAIIVACDPVLHISGPDTIGGVTSAALHAATAVELGGFKFPAPVAVQPPPVDDAMGGGTYAHRTQALGAWIVGVMLELFP